MSKIIGVDCDLVLSQSDKLWWEWLHRMTGCTVNRTIPKEDAHYNLTKYWNATLSELEIDGMDFWKSNLYDWVDPVKGSEEALWNLKREGYQVVVVSACKSGHEKSKYRFIKRHFPLVDGVIFTREKHFARVDIFVDDRIDVLNKMPEGVGCIKFDTRYTQNEDPTRPMITCNGWGEVVEYITRHD